MKKLARLLRHWAEKLDPTHGPIVTDAPTYRGEKMQLIHLRQQVDLSRAAHPNPQVQQDNEVYLMERTEEAMGETASQCVRWTEQEGNQALAELVVLKYIE